jgi:hypothetical protein
MGERFLDSSQNFHTLNGIDAKITFEIHGRLDHFSGVSGEVRYSLKKNGHELVIRLRRVLGRSNGRRGIRFELLEDFFESAQGTKAGAIDSRELGEGPLNGSKDFDTLNRVNSQITLEIHGKLNHGSGIASKLSNNLEKNLGYGRVRDGRGRGGRGGNGRGCFRGAGAQKFFAHFGKCSQTSQSRAIDRRQLGEASLNGRQDFHALDGIDAEIALHVHG